MPARGSAGPRLRLGVTGTDTGVGKTVVAAALVAALREDGLDVAAMKPVETGVPYGDPTSDAALLASVSGARLADVCPVAFAEPLAPMVAAEREGTPVRMEVLDAAFTRLCEGRDAVVVEGAGGLLVPITPTLAYAALFRRWELAVLIVAANRLGAINHALLTVRAAQDTSLNVLAIVMTTAPDAEALVADTNAAAIAALAPGIPVVSFPWVTDPRDASLLSAAARRSGVIDICSAAGELAPGSTAILTSP